MPGDQEPMAWAKKMDVAINKSTETITDDYSFGALYENYKDELQLKELIIGSRGFSAWTELQNIRKEVRQQRKAEEAERIVEKQKRAEAVLTVAVIILSATALFGGMYLFAIYTGLITW